jgi:ATP-dependent RNA helicase HelY
MGIGLLDAYDRSFAAYQAQTGSQSARTKKRNAARATLLNRIQILRSAGYLGDEGILDRGKVAQKINGYEIQVTELLFGGVLDGMDIHQLAVTFAALIHEERRSADPRNSRALGSGMEAVTNAVQRFINIEIQHSVREPIKEPDWGIAAAINSWSHGGSVEDLARLARTDAGDVVRILRMAIQMMRQVRMVLSKQQELGHRLDEAIVAINRDVIDAKRQFELG